MARLKIHSRSGHVRVTAEVGATLDVQGGNVEVHDDGTTEVRAAKGGSKALEVRVPAGTDVVIGTASGSIELEGPLGEVWVSSHSGRIEVEEVRQLDARTKSGSVKVHSCEGECRVWVASGSIRIGRAGKASLAGVSGSIHGDEVDAADVKTVSGTVELGSSGGPGRIAVHSVSGTVKVTVPRTMAPATRLKSISGTVQCDAPRGHDGEISIKTVSGTIQVTCR
jgi:DUF4097 and DUF4098 domain-containing protein YvlB